MGIEGTISRIQLLLENQGYTEHYVYKQGDNRIVVEVAKLTDTDYLFEQLNEPANFKITTENNASGRCTFNRVMILAMQVILHKKGNDGVITTWCCNCV